MEVIDGKLVEVDEPRFFLEDDSICYGCIYYGEDGCQVTKTCVEGNMNGYRMRG